MYPAGVRGNCSFFPKLTCLCCRWQLTTRSCFIWLETEPRFLTTDDCPPEATCWLWSVWHLTPSVMFPYLKIHLLHIFIFGLVLLLLSLSSIISSSSTLNLTISPPPGPGLHLLFCWNSDSGPDPGGGRCISSWIPGWCQPWISEVKSWQHSFHQIHQEFWEIPESASWRGGGLGIDTTGEEPLRLHGRDSL